jgi:hypothetical protein
LSIFAAPLSGSVSGFESSAPDFFGAGTRAAPAEVVANRVSDSIASAVRSTEVGATLFVFRSPVSLRPGQSVRLRYAYGMAHPGEIPRLVSRYVHAAGPFRASELAWTSWLPKVAFGPIYRWAARELVWDAYLLRSATVYEEGCGEHTITQGGDYQYALGQNLGFRSWLHYLLPILLGAVEYGLGARDIAFFHQRLSFYGSNETASVWPHVKMAVAHQESLLGPHRLYALPPGFFGDWNDASVQFEHLTESTLVAAQLAYIYPRLAELADRPSR